MQHKQTSPWIGITQAGLIGGALAILISLIGMVEAFGVRYIVTGWFTMGQVLLFAPILLMSYSGIRRIEPQPKWIMVVGGFLSGLIGGILLSALVLIGQAVNLRVMFPHASPELYEILTFGLGVPTGLFALLLVSAAIGGLAAGALLLRPRLRRALVMGLVWVLLLGLFRDLIMTVVNQWVDRAKTFADWAAWARLFVDFTSDFVRERVFATSGLRPLAAILVFVVVALVDYRSSGRTRPVRKPGPGDRRQRTRRLVTLSGAGIVVLILPLVLGIFFAEILDNVGLYIMMGLGLNIVVGFAGLLDLGYVAFYAIGAYTMGVLTSPELGFFNLTYWQALPFALLAALLAGIILGLPVLRMRGDYLAIVTLGFGEIVRLLFLSDWLRPWVGGTQGIQRIAQPVILGITLNTQVELYYLFLVGIAIVGFVAWRLKDSRLGRSWMALREDEDVAKATGINHVNTKLLAFATGAVFSGFAGTIFASKLQSVYPHSMNFLVSINVLAVIIVGGMGSIPGVFVGALALIAAPELLREFAEYRYLVYGAVLVAMMLTKPEGLWPEERRKLELHEAEEAPVPESLAPAATGPE
jgi:branched-chain amino acid transport system permease protein